MIRLALLVASLLWFNCLLAHAQTLPGDRDLIRERQERVLEEQSRRLEELQQLPGEQRVQPPAPAMPEALCFDIQRISLSGASLISQAQ